jgi:magnesium transporter
MARNRRRRIPHHFPGGSPGTLVVPPGSLPTTVRITEFDAQGMKVQERADLKHVERGLEDPRTSWVEVVGFGDAELLRGLGKTLGMSDLTLEDVVNNTHRPTIQAVEAGLLVVLRSPTAQDPGDLRQVSIFATRRVVATFVEQPCDLFQPLYHRLKDAQSRLRRRGHDYLVYRIVAALVDAYFPHIELMADRLDRIEAEVDERPSSAPFKELHEIRRRLRTLHRVALPQRAVCGSLMRNEAEFFDQRTLPFLHDAYDHATQAAELTEHYRGVASDVHELIRSALNLRLTEVTRILTTVATIFIPLHFVVGLYGMNFSGSPWNMPELHWRYGYPAVLLLLVVVAFSTTLWVRRKGLTKVTDQT